jgi:DNA-binding HxlR family transcriptional regulator
VSPDNVVRDVLELLGDKWMLPVVHSLSSGPKRYGQLQACIPDVTQSMLTRTLQRMERNGVVVRTQYQGIPPPVEYELTELGRSLQEPLHALAVWGCAHLGEVRDARQRYGSPRDWSAPAGRAG